MSETRQLATAGCSFSSETEGPYDRPEPEYLPTDPCERDSSSSDCHAANDQAMAESMDQTVPASAGWSCNLDVTYNEDWHDDVVCSNGVEAHRPYLREWDDFVEERELMESAAEYEAELNAAQ